MDITEKINDVAKKAEVKDGLDLGESLKSLIPMLLGLLIFTLLFAMAARYIVQILN